jgi:hypothetical protein
MVAIGLDLDSVSKRGSPSICVLPLIRAAL